ncbi:MAG: hypothetical protein ACE5H4_09210 [Candidatus Thorarchaeota archaeon]
MGSDVIPSRTLIGVILIGGIFELVMGFAVLAWGDLIVSLATGMTTIPSYPLYWRTMGVLAMALGSLQIVAAQNPQRYVAVPVAACLVRFFLPVLTGLQVIDTPSMATLLIVSTAFDFILALATLVLLYRDGLIAGR